MSSHRARLTGGAAVVGSLTLALVVPGVSALAAVPGASPAHGSDRGTYVRTNLVADRPGHAQTTDPDLKNPWGVSYGPGTPIWVSDQATGLTTLYSGGVHGSPQTTVPLVVKVPGGGPTGQVFNPTTSFVVHGAGGSSAPATFLFVGVGGHLTGWAPTVPLPAPSLAAQDAVVTPGAVDTGLAIGSAGGGPRLYAADFTAGTVDVYDGAFRRVVTAGNFADRRLPDGYAPFNVAFLGGKVYVAYAKQGATRGFEQDGKGLGRVDVFTPGGVLLHRLVDSGQLDAPWGLTIAPAGFGTFSGDLLVGNFGDGRIHAYDAHTLASRGTVLNGHGRPMAVDGLWALTPGNGVEGATDQVVFTAGTDEGAHGLLGTISAHE